MPVGYLQIVLDTFLVLLLVLLLWRLRRDPSELWQRRERELRRISESLRSMVLQAEGLARELDRSLADRAGEISTLLKQAEATAGQVRSPNHNRLASRPEQVEHLLGRGLSPEEVAHRLELPLAEVRLAANLGAWRRQSPGQPDRPGQILPSG